MPLNKVLIEGNLTRNPELKETESVKITKFGIASNEKFKGEERANFFDCVAFGKMAETVKNLLTKGSRVIVEGRLRQNRWENQDGESRSKIEIILDTFHIIRLKSSEDTTSTKEETTDSESEVRHF